MKKVLYLGLDPPKIKEGEEQLYFPVIQIRPRPRNAAAITAAYGQLPNCTHILFTSKSAVRIFFNYLPFYANDASLKDKKIIAIGKATAKEIAHFGEDVWKISAVETAEGVIAALEGEINADTFFLWPHSALSRPVISDYFKKNNFPLAACIFYDTEIGNTSPPPSLHDIEEIVFTSPSTVDGFLKVYGNFPKNVILRTIGPVTQNHLSSVS